MTRCRSLYVSVQRGDRAQRGDGKGREAVFEGRGRERAGRRRQGAPCLHHVRTNCRTGRRKQAREMQSERTEPRDVVVEGKDANVALQPPSGLELLYCIIIPPLSSTTSLSRTHVLSCIVYTSIYGILVSPLVSSLESRVLQNDGPFTKTNDHYKCALQDNLTLFRTIKTQPHSCVKVVVLRVVPESCIARGRRCAPRRCALGELERRSK